MILYQAICSENKLSDYLATATAVVIATAAAIVVAATTTVVTTTAEDENKDDNPPAAIAAEPTVVTHCAYLLSLTLHNIAKSRKCYKSA